MNVDNKEIISVATHLQESWRFESPMNYKPYPVIMGSTYREGGFSQQPYASLNLAFHVGDNPDDVVKNRGLVADYLRVDPTRMTCANQVHGLRAIQITEELIGAGAFGERTAINDCDALFTNIPNVPLLLFTADCVPVGVYDTVKHVVGVVHAGWKGAIGHLPVITIQEMTKAYGTKPEDCIAFLGPSIGPNSFEVNQELADRFKNAYDEMDSTIVRANTDSYVGRGKNTHVFEETLVNELIVRYIKRYGSCVETLHVNLWEFIRADLVRLGVPNSSIVISGTDSLMDEHCFSYRRESGQTGRMAMFGMLI